MRQSSQMLYDFLIWNLTNENAIRLPFGILCKSAIDFLRACDSFIRASNRIGFVFSDVQKRHGLRVDDVAVTVVGAKQNGVMRRYPVEHEARDFRIHHNVMPDSAENPCAWRSLFDRRFDCLDGLPPTRL